MNLKIYIFGTPHNFDLYPNETGKASQFQLYEYESSNNVRFMIQRSGTQIIYSYLRYQLFSERNVQGAFFGMAVEFENEYCTDVKNLYILFETIYQDVLQKGILLKQSDKHIKFQVFTFKNENGEIKNIERTIRKSIKKEFVNKFKPFNSQNFSHGINETRLAKMNIDVGKRNILNAMKDYPNLSLSPEYPRPANKTKKTTQQQLLDLSNYVQGLTQKMTIIEKNVIKQQETKIETKEETVEKTGKTTKNEMLQNERIDIEEKQKIESEDGNSRNTEPKNEETNEKTENIFNDKWLKILFFVAVSATIWLICSIINIVNIWGK